MAGASSARTHHYHTYSDNSLTNFKYEVHANDRKWKLCELAETCKEKFIKSHHVNLFLAGFLTFGTIVRRRARLLGWQ